MKSEKQVRKRIEQLESKIERLEKVAYEPMQTPGPFVTGRSGYKLGKKLDAENDRKAQAFRELQKAKKDLAHYTALLNDYLEGERHLNGQRRADAPSRLQAAKTRETLAAFLGERLKKGDKVAVAANPRNHITIKRVNKKTVTSESGSSWRYDEILPMEGDKAMSYEKLTNEFKAWLQARENQS